ncbi:hypothetical protein HanIR_Chr01g0014601 [Helianthus annuus]|nr:hypothetical protein HanIR_Chr01g0014601 [Helianthus annuus]
MPFLVNQPTKIPFLNRSKSRNFYQKKPFLELKTGRVKFIKTQKVCLTCVCTDTHI